MLQQSEQVKLFNITTTIINTKSLWNCFVLVLLAIGIILCSYMGQRSSTSSSSSPTSGQKKISSEKDSGPAKSKMSSPVIVSASGKHTATLIFLHGLGDTGHGWASTLADFRESHVRIVCPTAPVIPVTLNSGFQMPAWFDLMSLDPNGTEDDKGINKSKAAVVKLIEEEIANGIDPSRIVLGGFSQGGALAIYTGLTCKYKLAGIIGLSCWLPLHKGFPAAAGQDNIEVPIMQAHGDCDPVVPYRWGQLTSTTLKTFCKNHDFKTYKGLSHSSSPVELQDIKTFMQNLIPAEK